MADYYTSEQIWNADAGLVALDSDEVRSILCRVLVKLPAEIMDNLFENCRFIMPIPEEKGCYLPRSLIGGRDIIVFPWAMLECPEEDQEHTVLHEIAHHILKHRSPAEHVDLDWIAQEDEADAQVEVWRDAWQLEQGADDGKKAD